MEAVMAEMPLTIFTTLAPFGAGAFVALALYGWRCPADDTDVVARAKLGIVPLVIMIVALIAAFFHLASPWHALWAVFGLGSSPLTNEVAGCGAFFVVALVTCLLGATGKLKARSFQVLATVSAVLALVFAVLMGIAYAVPTVPSWNSPLLPVIALGETLAGGALLLLAVLAFGKGSLPRPAATALAVLALAGAVIAVGSEIWWFAEIGNLSTALVDAGALRDRQSLIVGAGCALMLAAAGGGAFAALGRRALPPWLCAAAVAAALIGVFLLRIAFYALYITAGL